MSFQQLALNRGRDKISVYFFNIRRKDHYVL